MNCSSDSIVEKGEARYYFRYLQWDTNFFGRPCYILEPDQSVLLSSNDIKRMITKQFRNSFITVKLNTNTSNRIPDFLQECGFRYIDTEVVLECKKTPKNSLESQSMYVERMYENSQLPYNDLGACFTLTRFHCDVNIDNVKADELWSSYLRNYEPNNEKYMFVAKKDKETILGAVLVNVSHTVAYIFFISVLKPYQSLGVGSLLLSSVYQAFPRHIVRTGTQVKNVVALNFYIKNGLSKIHQTNTVLHRWQ